MKNSENKKPPAAGNGRPKGAPNKTTKLLKDAILKAAEQAGNNIGDDGLTSYLEHQAIENPVAFMTLLGKVLPMQITGENGGAIQQAIRFTFVSSDDDENK